MLCGSPYPLDFLFSYGVADPFRGVRLARTPGRFRRGRATSSPPLRAHERTFQLAASLKTQHHRIVGLAVLRDRRVQLRQPLQGRLVRQNDHTATRTHPALIHQAQHQHVPATD